LNQLNASDDRGIDVVREQIKNFASTKKIFSSGFKLIILDEADMMTQTAQNALRRGKIASLFFFFFFRPVPDKQCHPIRSALISTSLILRKQL